LDKLVKINNKIR